MRGDRSFAMLRTVARGLAIAALAALASAASAAETYYADRVFTVSGDGPRETRSCQAILIPAIAFGGDSAPRIAIATHGSNAADLVSLGIDNATRFEEPVLVQNNQRQPIVPLVRDAFRNFRASGVVAAILSRKPFFITARRGGQYVSSRYENVDLDRVLSRIEENCPFGAEDLMGDTSGREGAEGALDLSASQIRHIRWVLHQKYGKNEEEPPVATALLADERNYVKSYTAEKGLPVSQYLTEESARLLLEEKFESRFTDFSTRDDFETIAAWVFFTANKGRTCAIAGKATSFSEGSWRVPYMYYEARRGESGKRMVIDLVSPNPFDPKREVSATVDGVQIPLQIAGGKVGPRVRKGSKSDLSVDMVKSLRGASRIEITGVSKATGDPLTIGYSSAGFGSAFQKMMVSCNRAKGLRAWIRQ